MRFLPLLAALVWAAPVFAATGTSAPPAAQSGRLATVTLVATQRVSGRGAPDGLRFLFLIQRAAEVTGGFTLKEPRDFTIGGSSYRERTQAELGHPVEPATVFDEAEDYFAKHPQIRHLAPEDLRNIYVLEVTIGGAPLTAGDEAEIPLQVGFGQQVEPFAFRTVIVPQSPKR